MTVVHSLVVAIGGFVAGCHEPRDGTGGDKDQSSPDYLWSDLSTGSLVACGVLRSGGLRCVASFAVLEDGDPDGLAAAPDGTFAAVASEYHSCAVSSIGGIACWGPNDKGQSSPPGASDFAHVVVGDDHACALTTAGEIECWGLNNDGQANAPTGQYVDVAAGSAHSCGVSTEGELVCWGNDLYSGLAADLAGVEVVDVDIYGLETCALGADGTPHCTDVNFDQGATVGSHLVAGASTACALDSDGFPECWGDYVLGSAKPPDVPLVHLDASNEYACGLSESGEAYCWGLDYLNEDQSSEDCCWTL